jgi:hypothetical protein
MRPIDVHIPADNQRPTSGVSQIFKGRSRTQLHSVFAAKLISTGSFRELGVVDRMELAARRNDKGHAHVGHLGDLRS